MAIGLWDDKPTLERAQDAVHWLRRTLQENPTDHMTAVYLPQMENAEECPGCVSGANWAANDGHAWVAVLTNLYNERSNPNIAQQLGKAGVAAMPEVYANENKAWSDRPVDFENALIYDCKRLGYEYVIPLLGVYWDYALNRYQPKSLPGSWNYLGETMTDRQGDWDIYFQST